MPQRESQVLWRARQDILATVSRTLQQGQGATADVRFFVSCFVSRDRARPRAVSSHLTYFAEKGAHQNASQSPEGRTPRDVLLSAVCETSAGWAGE